MFTRGSPATQNGEAPPPPEGVGWGAAVAGPGGGIEKRSSGLQWPGMYSRFEWGEKAKKGAGFPGGSENPPKEDEFEKKSTPNEGHSAQRRSS